MVKVDKEDARITCSYRTIFRLKVKGQGHKATYSLCAPLDHSPLLLFAPFSRPFSLPYLPTHFQFHFHYGRIARGPRGSKTPKPGHFYQG